MDILPLELRLNNSTAGIVLNPLSNPCRIGSLSASVALPLFSIELLDGIVHSLLVRTPLYSIREG